MSLTRRDGLRALLVAPAAFGCGTTGGSGMDAGAGASLALTPVCKDGDPPSPSQTEGPYWKPSSPERTSLLEPGLPGTRLVLEGFVVSERCGPIAEAVVDLWHCDDGGEYDNAGFRLRGHQRTAADGLYRFETLLPGLYPGRTRHFHVKIQRPGGPVLTTQLYFPGEAGNARDGIYDRRLLIARADAGTARFTFVV